MQRARASPVMNTKLFLVKLGGSIITDRDKPDTPNLEVMARLAKEIKNASSETRVLVTHGGGSFGHVVAHKYDVGKGFTDEKSRLGTSLTRFAMHRLTSFMLQAMIDAGLNPMPFPPSAGALAENGRILQWDVAPIKAAMERGFTPLTNGDVVSDTVKGISIVSGEETLAYLSRSLKPDKVIVAGDIDGVFTADPRIDAKARLIPIVDKANATAALGSVGPSTHVDVTGGMASKLRYLYDISKENGISCQIVNALAPGRLEAALEDKNVVGTVIKA